MTDKKLAYLGIRIVFGFNILIHGASRVFQSYDHFVADTVNQFASSPLPSWSVKLFAYSIPPVEMLLGVCLIAGILKRYTCVIGLALMASLVFGMGVLQKWDIVGLQMTYVLFYFLVLFLSDWDSYSVDRLIADRRPSSADR